MLPLETNPEDLVRRIAAGDHVAERELVERYGTGLRNVIRRWSRDPATADDLYQETLKLALAKIRRGEVREPGQIVAYLSSLAKNLSIQLYPPSGTARSSSATTSPSRAPNGSVPLSISRPTTSRGRGGS